MYEWVCDHHIVAIFLHTFSFVYNFVPSLGVSTYLLFHVIIKPKIKTIEIIDGLERPLKSSKSNNKNKSPYKYKIVHTSVTSLV